MISQKETTRNDIVLTRTDHDRLRELVDSSRYRTTHAFLLGPLRRELDRGRVVDPKRVSKRVVTMRSQVQVRDLGTGERETYTIVYPEEADIDEGKLSVWAPLAIALLGAQAGRVVQFDAPGGPRRLKVEKILYQPEAAGAFDL